MQITNLAKAVCGNERSAASSDIVVLRSTNRKAIYPDEIECLVSNRALAHCMQPFKAILSFPKSKVSLRRGPWVDCFRMFALPCGNCAGVRDSPLRQG